MEQTTRRRRINASPEQVWERLADYDGLAAWAPQVNDASLLTEQASGAGTTRRVRVRRLTLTETVVSWEPGVELAYEIEGIPFAEAVTTTWALTPDLEATMVAVTSEVDVGPSLPGRLAAKPIVGQLRRAADQMLKGLATAVEAGSARP